MNEETVIHIVDDDEPFRTALARLLKAAGYHVQVYGTAGEFLIATKNESPGCLLLDMCMPGPNGLELQQAMMNQGRSLPIIFLTGFGDVPTTVTAMKAGAVDFLTKPVQRQALLAAVRTALQRDQDSRASNLKLKHFLKCFESLTAREKEVLSGVVSGKLNKQIAVELGTAERTIKAHRAHLMEKMRAGSLAELVQIADLLSRKEPSCSGLIPSDSLPHPRLTRFSPPLPQSQFLPSSARTGI